MKRVISTFLITGAAITFFSCSDSKGRYVDLSTGEAIEVEKDEKTGAMVNADTKDALYIYVDTEKKDTIYGPTGEVINGRVIKTDDDKYVFEDGSKLKVEDGETKYKDGDYKMEVEKDGDVIIKDGENKVKTDGETGERKVKKEN
jgi:hypothetical protein